MAHQKDVTLITPTRDRPVAMDLCKRWVERQDYTGNIQWIIADGSEERGPKIEIPGIDVVHLRTHKPDLTPLESFIGNLLAALPIVTGEYVIIIEDDDWYAPNHVSDTADFLEKSSIVGNQIQRYYHLPSKQWTKRTNRGSCLCQTGFRKTWISMLETACHESLSSNTRGVDARFWQSMIWRLDICLHSDAPTCIGMKGLPGSKGIGVGHDPDRRDWNDDPDLVKLREWVGDDSSVYESLTSSPSD